MLAWYNSHADKLERVKKQSAFNILPRNAEQAFALDAILRPEVRLVTIQGVAGTGKTLLSLAGALEQRRNYHQIYLARPIVPLSNKDIGYLPGDVKSKLNPYMEPLWDNLKFIKSQFSEKDREFKQINEMVENEKLVVCPLAYIRGRSLSNVFLLLTKRKILLHMRSKQLFPAQEKTRKLFSQATFFKLTHLTSTRNPMDFLT